MASVEKYERNLEDVCPMPCGQNQPLLCRPSSPFPSILGIGSWRAMSFPSLLPLEPGSYWGYASPPQKPLESKAQRDSLMGGSGQRAIITQLLTLRYGLIPIAFAQKCLFLL